MLLSDYSHLQLSPNYLLLLLRLFFKYSKSFDGIVTIQPSKYLYFMLHQIMIMLPFPPPTGSAGVSSSHGWEPLEC